MTCQNPLSPNRVLIWTAANAAMDQQATKGAAAIGREINCVCCEVRAPLHGPSPSETPSCRAFAASRGGAADSARSRESSSEWALAKMQRMPCERNNSSAVSMPSRSPCDSDIHDCQGRRLSLCHLQGFPAGRNDPGNLEAFVTQRSVNLACDE
jgi:hypothetical protein